MAKIGDYVPFVRENATILKDEVVFKTIKITSVYRYHATYDSLVEFEVYEIETYTVKIDSTIDGYIYTGEGDIIIDNLEKKYLLIMLWM